MTVRGVFVAVLLVLGVGLQLLCAVGLLAMRDTFSRLHYVAPGGFGLAAIAAAIVVRQSFSLIGDHALATAAIVLLTGPVLVHVTARTARARRLGDWTIRRGEDVERVRP